MTTQSSRSGHDRPRPASAVSDLSEAASQAASKTLGEAQAVAQEQYDNLTAAIRRNPLQAAGIAAGIGFVIALLARR